VADVFSFWGIPVTKAAEARVEPAAANGLPSARGCFFMDSAPILERASSEPPGNPCLTGLDTPQIGNGALG
jgi:hypothetical protein